jgi:polyisoprenoid-binding protein YceI
VRPNSEAYLLEGDLTIKGVTKPVTLNLEFNGAGPGQDYGEVSGYELRSC